MLAWSVEAALESGVFTTVMVSTDDSEIADIAESLGAEVPFMRSEATSDDFSTTADVLKEVLEQYEERGEFFENSCCLYPTAPLITASDLKAGHDKLLEGAFDVVLPVAAFSYPIWRSLKSDANGKVSLNFPENLNRRSQDLPLAYHDAGQWYWFRTRQFLNSGTLMGDNTGAIQLSELKIQDIDTEEDWALAEIKHERLFAQCA